MHFVTAVPRAIWLYSSRSTGHSRAIGAGKTAGTWRINAQPMNRPRRDTGRARTGCGPASPVGWSEPRALLCFRYRPEAQPLDAHRRNLRYRGLRRRPAVVAIAVQPSRPYAVTKVLTLEGTVR